MKSRSVAPRSPRGVGLHRSPSASRRAAPDGPRWAAGGASLRRALFGLLVLAAACGEPPRAVTPEPVSEPPPEPASEPPPALQFAPVPPVLLREVGLSGPTSALYDPLGDVYLVSNVNGEALAHDDNGFISRVRPDGTVEALRWIDGALGDVTLDAPKGMALVGDVLYVADIDVVRSFDRTSGAALGKSAVVSAVALEDVAAAADGTVFVCDSGRAAPGAKKRPPKGAAAVYALDARGVPRAVAKGPELEQPRSLLAVEGGVVVITASGKLYRLSPAGAREVLGALPAEAVGGSVQLPDGRALVSSAGSSSVYVSQEPLAAGAEFDVLIGELKAPGDLGFDPKRKQVLVPLVEEHSLYIQQVP